MTTRRRPMHPRLAAAFNRLLRGREPGDPLARPFLVGASSRLVPMGHRDECPTLGVDEWWRIYWNDGFVEAAPMEELVAAAYHELGHLLEAHHQRLRHLPHHVANDAGDAAINGRLRAEGFQVSPNYIFPETLGAPDNLTAEQYAAYARQDQRSQDRPQNQDQGQDKGQDQAKGRGQGQNQDQGQGQDQAKGRGQGQDQDKGQSQAKGRGQGQGQNQGQGQGQGHRCGSSATGRRAPWEDDSPGADDDFVSEKEAEVIRRQVAKAVREHAGRGRVPSDWERWADRVLAPKDPNFERVVRGICRRTAAVIAAGKDDVSFKRLRRKYAPPDVILPGCVKYTPRVGVVIDTSGSISDTQLAHALWVVTSWVIAECYDPVVVVCDSDVHHVVRHCRGVSQLRHLVKGGGGTDMRKGIHAALRERVDAVFVITDCDTPWPQERPTVPVVVFDVGNGRHNVPEWARRVKVKLYE